MKQIIAASAVMLILTQPASAADNPTTQLTTPRNSQPSRTLVIREFAPGIAGPASQPSKAAESGGKGSGGSGGLLRGKKQLACGDVVRVKGKSRHVTCRKTRSVTVSTY